MTTACIVEKNAQCTHARKITLVAILCRTGNGCALGQCAGPICEASPSLTPSVCSTGLGSDFIGKLGKGKIDITIAVHTIGFLVYKHAHNVVACFGNSEVVYCGSISAGETNTIFLAYHTLFVNQLHAEQVQTMRTCCISKFHRKIAGLDSIVLVEIDCRSGGSAHTLGNCSCPVAELAKAACPLCLLSL